MAYTINKTDGTIVATVADGQIDTFSTDLTLIGKNYSGYGEAFNENFVKLLENFAATAQPVNPVRGQIWFDASELKLKVYTGTAFVPVSSATINNTQPTTLGVGDLWFNDVDKQLFFFDGVDTILLGPAYSDSQLISGLRVESILDTLNQTRVVTKLYNAGILLGIFSKDTFTPKNVIEGYQGGIVPGFNAGTLAGIKFDVTCTNSEQLGGVVATNYVRKDTSNQINGQLRLSTDLGLIIGSAGNLSFSISNGDAFISNTADAKRIVVNLRRGSAQEDAISISPSLRTIDFYDGYSDSEINFGGNVTIEGNLTINGDTTSVNVATLTVEDKTIELAKQDGVVPSDTNADGGGVILQGDNPKVILWSDLGAAATGDLPKLMSKAWNSSEIINVASGKYYAIDGVPILDATTVYVTNFPNVNKLGPQVWVDVGYTTVPPGGVIAPDAEVSMRLINNRIYTTKNDLDLELFADGTGNVVLNGTSQIKNLADPTDQQDAATKEYVDDVVETRALAFSMDLTDGKSNAYIITNILNNLAPPADFRNDTIARILCTILSNSTTSLDINPLLATSTATFNTPTGTAPAVISVSSAPATVTGSTISTLRIIKEFRLTLGVWQHSRDIILPP